MKRSKRLLILFIIGLMLFLPFPAGAQDDGPIYIVQPGDTLFGIARRFGTSVESIMAINAIADSARIFPGMELTIPGFPGVSGVLTFSIVEFGLSLDTIARNHGISASDLARLNRVVNPSRVYAGQSIIVPELLSDETSPPPGAPFLVSGSLTRLELAARDDANPWVYKTVDDQTVPLWQLPGMVLINPSSESAGALLLEPLMALEIAPLPLIQGQTTVIRVETSRPMLLIGSLGEHELGFFAIDEGTSVALQGMHALAVPGPRQFRLEMIDPDTQTAVYEFEQSVLLEPAGYGTTSLNGVPPETIDPEVTGPEEALIAGLLAPKSPVRRWDGPFEYPSRYYTDELIAYFGTRRSYNNGAFNYYHTGVDFYGSNVPIYAPAPGEVVFAGPLTVRGNATYIDHGWGVYSGYLHQSEIDVQVGDVVDAGQVIGLVGNTGRVTGPHLHWEIWVGGVPVEPLTWIERSFP